MVLDKKQIRSIFVLGFKMGPIGAKTTHNINDAFGPGTANKHTVQWWFKFCKGDESLEDKEPSGRPWEGGIGRWRAVAPADLLQRCEKLPKNSDANHFTVTRHLKKLNK